MAMRLMKIRSEGATDLLIYHCVLTSDAAGACTGRVRVPGRRVSQVNIFSETATPTTAWDLTISDVDSIDILGGQGANIVSATPVAIQPRIGAAVHEAGGVLVNGELVLAATNMGDTKQASVKIFTEPATIDDQYGT